jgi:putative folate metabolism gamma-glutamate ligase
MLVKVIKTHKIVSGSLFTILDRYIKKPAEGSVLAITSKIVSICEGRIEPVKGTDKQKLIEQESEYFIKPSKNSYGIALSIKNGVLAPMAGIDESNANGFYILWPKDAQKTANEVREHFVKKFKLKKFGVIITDSRTTPLRWGTTGFALAHSGFQALNNYIGKSDIFGRKLRVSKANIMDGLAGTAVLMMGEGKEQTPLALISDLPFVAFQPRNPTKLEIRNLKLKIGVDLYAPLLKNAGWKKGCQN